MRDLNGRIQQLTNLILTSATVKDSQSDENSTEEPSSPVKIDFDMSPYQLQQELLSARLTIESQAQQILSLESSLLSRPPLPADASEGEKDLLIKEQGKTIRELEIVVRGYEENLGEPLRKVKEDVEKEWVEKVEEERKERERSEKWAEELVKALEKEKKVGVFSSFFPMNGIFLRSELMMFWFWFDFLAQANVGGGTSCPCCVCIQIRCSRARNGVTALQTSSTTANTWRSNDSLRAASIAQLLQLLSS